MLTAADYDSFNPHILQMIAIRSEVVTRVKEEGVDVNAFCAHAHIGNGTFYRLEQGKYVEYDAWGRVLNSFTSVVPYEVYKEYLDRYGKYRFLAFGTATIERKKKVKKPSRLIAAALQEIKDKACTLLYREMIGWMSGRSDHYRQQAEGDKVITLKKDEDVTPSNIKQLVIQQMINKLEDFIDLLDERRL